MIDNEFAREVCSSAADAIHPEMTVAEMDEVLAGLASDMLRERGGSYRLLMEEPALLDAQVWFHMRDMKSLGSILDEAVFQSLMSLMRDVRHENLLAAFGDEGEDILGALRSAAAFVVDNSQFALGVMTDDALAPISAMAIEILDGELTSSTLSNGLHNLDRIFRMLSILKEGRIVVALGGGEIIESHRSAVEKMKLIRTRNDDPFTKGVDRLSAGSTSP